MCKIIVVLEVQIRCHAPSATRTTSSKHEDRSQHAQSMRFCEQQNAKNARAEERQKRAEQKVIDQIERYRRWIAREAKDSPFKKKVMKVKKAKKVKFEPID
eukprot:gnl/TRDRNA2_/TRDRNA2_75225_c0_seq1.p2 gnl/TRDRNA2_/TRDRNA2_75225_c0~~gnl/TRDRNA2_/TRDRNA2_75225_c0_seq1.p2  ORF type:complete len:101 (-),score=22.73 gnl/TRDRNA2_/TRDRNA2_75225_c0_seq1:47-349(-)